MTMQRSLLALALVFGLSAPALAAEGADTPPKQKWSFWGPVGKYDRGQLQRGSVNLRYKSGSEDPQVALDACLHLAKDEVRGIVAQGSPADGDYQFTANPADVLSILSQHQNSAQIQGKTPGKGDLTVNYSFKGKTASTTVAGSVVELVSIAFLREFAVLMTAIVLAGRTASAFTAQIGAMKSREEIDAIRTLGLDPIDLLVIPRLLALLVMLPLLTFISMMAGLAGGVTVGAFDLGIPPQMYIARMHDTIEVTHFLVGMSKAPVFALVIGLIGCLEGLQVEGTAQSVGERTTSSVVQTISLVIIIDALAALWFMHMDW